MKPNILILLADQHRADTCGFAGNPEVRTPYLDRMAREGLAVSTCVSTHPLCAPYRACLQTGQPAAVNGVHANRRNGGQEGIRRDLPSLAGLFKQQGYQTAYFGKCHWHEAIDDSLYTPPEWRLGWEHWQGWHNGHEDYDLPAFDAQHQRIHPHQGRFAPEVQTEQFLDWHAQKEEGPWIAQMNWGPPHNATLSEEALDGLRESSKKINAELGLGLEDHHFEDVWWWVQSFPQYLATDVVPQRYLDLFDPDTLAVPENVHPHHHKLIQHHLREYYAQIAALDDLTGRIFATLAARGGLENTIVLYTADHGDWLGSHRTPEQNVRGKGNHLQSSVRVPFVVQGPGIDSGKMLDCPLHTEDILPTLCGLAGFEAGDSFPGENLASVLRGEEPVPQRKVKMSLQNWHSVYDGTWIYAAELTDTGLHPFALHQTREDPYDMKNRINDPDCAAVQAELHAWLAGEMG